MSVTLFKEPNFSGIYAQLPPGLYAGKDLVGCPHQSTSCEEFDRQISSARVDRNTILAFSDSTALRASSATPGGIGSGRARVIIGPAAVPDLGAMAGRVGAVMVLPIREYDSALPPGIGGVTLYDSPSQMGRRTLLQRGDYDAAWLASDSVRAPGGRIESLRVEAHVVAILYAGPGFEPDGDAVVVVGPTEVDDLDRLGFAGRVGSIRVLYTDPYDVPGRPTLPLGTVRSYTPGGHTGYNPGGYTGYAHGGHPHGSAIAVPHLGQSYPLHSGGMYPGGAYPGAVVGNPTWLRYQGGAYQGGALESGALARIREGVLAGEKQPPPAAGPAPASGPAPAAGPHWSDSRWLRAFLMLVALVLLACIVLRTLPGFVNRYGRHVEGGAAGGAAGDAAGLFGIEW